MKSRIQVIITALFACHLFLLPAVLTSQLRPMLPDSEPASAAPQDAGQPAAATPVPHDDANQNSSAPAPRISVTQDNNQEDQRTEQIIQQEIESAQEQPFGPPRPENNVVLGRDEVLIRGDEQEKNQDIYTARGHVVVHFRTYVLHADHITYDSTTGKVTATGNVVFDGGPHNEHLVGTRAIYDVSRDSGTFYDVVGSTGVKFKNKSIFLTSSTPFFFTGKVVTKRGPDHYVVHHGYITSCQLPKPKWKFNAQRATVEMGDEARMYHATLRIAGIPVFYFPFVEHPVDNLGRKSGFLLPVIGGSNSRGVIFGDGFFWAINRNSDLSIGTEMFFARGPSLRLDYRNIGYTYNFRADFYGVDDIYGYPSAPHQKQGGEEVKAVGNIALPWQFRGAVSLDLLSSYIFRLAFGQTFAESVNSEVRSSGFVSKSWNGYGLGSSLSRYVNYQSQVDGDYIAINHTPTLDFSSTERPLVNNWPVLYGYDLQGAGLSREEPGFHTPGWVGRVDVAPYLTVPKLFKGWTFRPGFGLRETVYEDQLEPTPGVPVGTVVRSVLNRNVLQASMEFRPPAVGKIFEHKPFGYVFKHTIEPEFIYRYQTGIHNFGDIIRFDYRDILADTNEIQYGFVTRLFAKKASSDATCYREPAYFGLGEAVDPEKAKAALAAGNVCDDRSGPAREVLTWELKQKYYMNPTFGGALVSGMPNVFDSTIDLTGIDFLTKPRIFSPIVSRAHAQYGVTDIWWALDYDPVLQQINASTVMAGYLWKNWGFGAGQTYLNAPGESLPSNGALVHDIFNQYRIGVTYGNLARRGLNAAASVGLDARNGYIQYSAIQATYNWDCCGVTFEYRRWALGLVRNENFYKFAFTLANFGTFGNLRRQDRLY